jgi:hypothetical protein
MGRWWLCWLVQVISLFGIVCSTMALIAGPAFLLLGLVCVGESAVLALCCIPDGIREERAHRLQRIPSLERELGFEEVPPPAPCAVDRGASVPDRLR